MPEETALEKASSRWQKKADAVKVWSERFKIATQEQFLQADQAVGRMNVIKKEIEVDKKEVCGSAYTAWQNAVAYFDRPLGVIGLGITVTKRKMTEFRDEQRRKAAVAEAAAQKKIDDDRVAAQKVIDDAKAAAAKAKADAQKKIDEANAKAQEAVDEEAAVQAVADQTAADAEKAEVAAAAAEANAAAAQAELDLKPTKAAPVMVLVPSTKHTTTKKTWQFEIEDEKKVPHEYRICKPDMPKIRLLMNREKGKAVLAGVRFFEKEDDVLKGGRRK